MIFDRSVAFSNNQAVQANGYSSNVVDLGALAALFGGTADAGKGTKIPIDARVTEGFNNLTSLTIAIENADDAAFSLPVTVFTSPAYGLARLTRGARLLPEAIPIGTRRRFLRLRFAIGGLLPSTGRISAVVTTASQTAGEA